MPIEEPKFSLVLKEGAFEIRDYAAAIAAEVTVKGTRDEASRNGFRLGGLHPAGPVLIARYNPPWPPGSCAGTR